MSSSSSGNAARPTVLRTALGRVLGLGSLRGGTEHWLGQRLTALALVPLSLWFTIQVIRLVHGHADLAAIKAWLANPVCASVLILTLGVTFHHAVNGLQVVIEDYVHTPCVKIASLVAVRFAGYALAVIGMLSVLKLAVGG